MAPYLPRSLGLQLLGGKLVGPGTTKEMCERMREAVQSSMGSICTDIDIYSSRGDGGGGGDGDGDDDDNDDDDGGGDNDANDLIKSSLTRGAFITHMHESRNPSNTSISSTSSISSARTLLDLPPQSNGYNNNNNNNNHCNKYNHIQYSNHFSKNKNNNLIPLSFDENSSNSNFTSHVLLLCADLLSHMLESDPGARYSPDEVLEHSFFLLKSEELAEHRLSASAGLLDGCGSNIGGGRRRHVFERYR